MRLVHHQQTDSPGDRRQDVFHEIVVRQPLGRNQEGVDLLRPYGALQFRPFFPVRRINRPCADSQPLGSLDLVPHNGKERGNDQRRSVSVAAKDARGDKVDATLAPPGALHDKQTLPSVHEGIDGFPLAAPKIGSRVIYHRSEKAEGL